MQLVWRGCYARCLRDGVRLAPRPVLLLSRRCAKLCRRTSVGAALLPLLCAHLSSPSQQLGSAATEFNHTYWLHNIIKMLKVTPNMDNFATFSLKKYLNIF
jgi:hypothetical protein